MRVSRSPKRKPGSFALVALVGFDCLAEAFFILAFSIWFELGGFTGSETEAQMQYFAEEVAPLVARACGGQVENPICQAELLPAQ